MFFVCYASFAEVSGGERVYASPFQTFDDCDADAFICVDFDAFWRDGWSSAFLGFGEFSYELFVFSDFLVQCVSVFVVVG